MTKNRMHTAYWVATTLLLLIPVATTLSISQHSHPLSSSRTFIVSQYEQYFPTTTAFHHGDDAGKVGIPRTIETMTTLRSTLNDEPGSSCSTYPTNDQTKPLFPEKLNIIYDGKCSVCRMEMEHLAERIQHLATSSKGKEDGKDEEQPVLLLRFTDLESGSYQDDDARNGGITYEMGMTSIHAVRQDGTVLHGVDVFREAYDIVGLGWVYAITNLNPTFRNISDHVYNFFATYRTQVTRGAKLQDLIQQHYGDDENENENECAPCGRNHHVPQTLN